MQNKYFYMSGLLNNERDRSELNKIFSEYIRPEMLKIAQQNLSMFDQGDHSESKHREEYRDPSFTFSSRIPQDLIKERELSSEFLDKLDELFVGLLNKYKNKSEEVIFNEIKDSFFTSSYNREKNKVEYWVPHNYGTTKQEYFDIVPQLRFNPAEGHQLNLPLKEIPESIQFGISKNKIEKRNEEADIANKIIEKIFKKEEYTPLDYTYSKRLSLGLSNQDIDNLILKRKNEILEALREAGFENLNIENYKNKFDKIDLSNYRDDIFERNKKEIEQKWHNIKKINEKIELEKKFFTVNNYEYKDFSSLSGIDDIFLEIINYAIWCSKKYISISLSKTPLSKKNFYSKQYVAKRYEYGLDSYDDIESLESLIKSTREIDIVNDMRRKLDLLQSEEHYQDAMLNNLKAWKNIFKRIDKDLFKRLKDSLSKISEDDKKIISWCLMFDRESIKEIYNLYMLKIASNIPNEQYNLKNYDDDDDDYQANRLATERLFDFDSLFSIKKTQASLLEKFIDNLNTFTQKIYENIFSKLIQNILKRLSSEVCSEFSKNYFTVKIDSYFRIQEDNNVIVEKIKSLLSNSNQRNELKSLQNVLNSFNESNIFDTILDDAELNSSTFIIYEREIFPKLYENDNVKKIFLSIDNFDEEFIYNYFKNNYLTDGYIRFESLLLQRISSTIISNSYYDNSYRSRYQRIATKNMLTYDFNKGFDEFNEAVRDMLQKRSYDGSFDLFYAERLKIQPDNMLYEKESVLNYIKKIYEIVSRIEPSLSENIEYTEEVSRDINILNDAIDKIMKNINKIYGRDLLHRIAPISKSIGGIGHKDIVMKVDKIFENINSQGISKKEIIEYIKRYIKSIIKNDPGIDILNNPSQKEFLDSLGSQFIESLGKFPGLATKVIEIFNVKDTETIIKIFINSFDSERRNFSSDDINRAIGILDIDKKNIDMNKINSTIKKIVESSSFIHNNSTISDDFIKKIINTENFYSDSDISKKYIKTCEKYLQVGTMASIRDNTSKFSKTIDVLVSKEIIKNKETFLKEIEEFENIFNTGNGIKINLGNKTIELKINSIIENEEYNNVFKNIETEVSNWNNLSSNEKIQILKEKVKLYEKNIIADLLKDESGIDNDSYVIKLINKIKNSINDAEQNSSTQEQYEEDMRIKKIISSTDAKLQLLIESDAFIKYAEISEKKDERMYDLNLNIPKLNIRFRVLEYMDPYHFYVGSDTNCCQTLSGQGRNATIDSFINNLSGVLVLEAMPQQEWVTLAQSYFHFVPNDNGVILDNVEINNVNITGYKNKINKYFSIDDIYAAYAKHISEKLKLSYFKCGKKYNKLTNGLFVNDKMGRDPRKFKWDKYSDFSTSNHLDLLRPKFEVTINLDDKIAMIIYNKIIKLSKILDSDELNNLVRFI